VKGADAATRCVHFTGLLSAWVSMSGTFVTTVANLAFSRTDRLQARDVHARIPADFRLASGETLAADVVTARIHGPADAPLIVVAGGISSGRFPCETDDGRPGWWADVVRPGGAIDPTRVRVLAIDFLPGLDETRVLTITTHDQARLLALVLDTLQVPVVDAFVGASYGGCVGLAFAELFPDRLGRLVVISAAHRAHPAATAWRGVQRRILALGLETGRIQEAVSLARELAMTTYRTAEEFDLRFGAAPAPETAGSAYAVCDYLTAKGRDYHQVTTPARWISLSDSLDRHSISPERIAAALTVVGFTSDRLAPIEDLRALADRAPNLETWIEAPSVFGHDGFLKERETIARALQTALSSLSCTRRSQEIAA